MMKCKVEIAQLYFSVLKKQVFEFHLNNIKPTLCKKKNPQTNADASFLKFIKFIQPKPVNENAPPTQNSGVGAPQKPGSPPIRVPTYHRPSILQVNP